MMMMIIIIILIVTYLSLLQIFSNGDWFRFLRFTFQIGKSRVTHRYWTDMVTVTEVSSDRSWRNLCCGPGVPRRNTLSSRRRHSANTFTSYFCISLEWINKLDTTFVSFLMTYSPSYQMLGLLLHTVPSNLNVIPSPGLTFLRYCVIPWLQYVRGSLNAPRKRTAGTTIQKRFYSKVMLAPSDA
jgi:hypothetical protein